MSLHKLVTFLKEHQHEILDYWILDQQIKWVKVVSKRSGEMYMINVFGFRLTSDSVQEIPNKTNQYIMQDCLPEDDTVACIFQNLKNFENKFVVLHGNEVYESQTSVYRATNLPKISHLSLYMMIDLEWFYDNAYVVSHEVQRSYQEIVMQTEEFVQKTTKNVSSFIRDERPIYNCVANLLKKYEKQKTSLGQCKDLFIRICKDESQTNIALYKVDDSIHPGDMTFKGAVHRQYLRKKLVDKADRLDHLKIGSMVNMNYYFNLKWNYLLQLLVFCLRINLLMEKILTAVFSMEKL